MVADKTAVTDDEVAAYIKTNSIPVTKGKEAEVAAGVKEQLKNDKTNQAVQDLIVQLKSAAKINYFVNY